MRGGTVCPGLGTASSCAPGPLKAVGCRALGTERKGGVDDNGELTDDGFGGPEVVGLEVNED